jgi:probable HAF family extracellular repeat protein
VTDHLSATIKTSTLLLALAIAVQLTSPIQASSQSGQQSRYRLVDLGTFGGPASSFADLNNRGTAVGWENAATTDPLCFFAPNCFTTHSFQARNGAITDLGVLPGGDSSAACCISSSGLIAGQSETGEFDPVYGLPVLHPVLWRNGQMIDLGLLPGGGIGGASGDVNDRGQVVGTALNTVPDPCNLTGLPTQFRAFSWQSGVMQDLGTLGGPDASASFINDRGQITGISHTDLINPATGCPFVHPYFWQNGTMLDIGTLGGDEAQPQSLNQLGQVVGISQFVAGSQALHPFLWSNGQLTDLGTLGGDEGETTFINDSGDIVGEADLPGPTLLHHAVLWKHGQIVDLGVLPGDSCSTAYFVNLHGQIVGSSTDQELCGLAGKHAVLWESGEPTDLNTLIAPGASLTLTFAFAINDKGEIAGLGVPPGCAPQDVGGVCGHAYMLIPCGVGEECVNTTLSPDSASAIPYLFNMSPTRPQTGSASPLERLRNQLRQKFHMPGQGRLPSD